MKFAVFKIEDEATANRRLFYGNTLTLFGLLLTWTRFELIGIFLVWAGGWFLWHAVSSRKIPNLPKWLPRFMLFLTVLANIAFIVLMIGKVGKVFLRW